MSDPIDLDELLDFDFDTEDDIPTNPNISRPVIIPDPPKPVPLVYKAGCTSCGSKTARILFNSIECDTPNCAFYKSRW